jgi:membrane protein YdbS with pleckstrin-like domain
MTVSCPSCHERVVIPLGATSPPPPPPVRLVAATTPKPQPASGATSYADSYLMPGENVVYHTRKHWAVFFPSLAAFIFAALLLLTRNEVLAPTGGLLVVFLVVPLTVQALITRATSEFAVTNKRVLIKAGWIRRDSLETLLSKIETISVEQGILGRAFDYGTIIVSGTGGSKEPFRTIASPMEFRRKVQEKIAASTGQS